MQGGPARRLKMHRSCWAVVNCRLTDLERLVELPTSQLRCPCSEVQSPVAERLRVWIRRHAENVYAALRCEGTQANVIDTMQTREELYERIGYHAFEQRLDALFSR